MESDLVAVLQTQCPRVFPDVAEHATALPYVTWQLIGGTPWRYVENSAADRRHSLVQINVWAATRAETLTLIRAIETALCAAAQFTVRPESEPIADMDDETKRRGCLQDFSIWSLRS